MKFIGAVAQIRGTGSMISPPQTGNNLPDAHCVGEFIENFTEFPQISVRLGPRSIVKVLLLFVTPGNVSAEEIRIIPEFFILSR